MMDLNPGCYLSYLRSLETYPRSTPLSEILLIGLRLGSALEYFCCSSPGESTVHQELRTTNEGFCQGGKDEMDEMTG